MQEGDVIDGRYRVEKKLGQGGMGQVFRGHDIDLNKTIAIKVLFPNTPDQIIKRFHAEAKALAALNHPNIMTVQHFGQASNGQLYLVMDFIKGDSLSARIEKRGAQTFFDMLPIFEKICRGLRYAHMNKVLHRDIKPSNVMLANELNKEDSVKLVDFGLAKHADKDQELTKTGAAMGSPPYMSPEAVHGKETDERSDIYSLGCTFFEMMAAVPPFVGDTPFHTMMAQINRLPPTLADASGKPFEEEVEVFIQKFLKKSPADRFQNMDEVVKELEKTKNAILERKRASEGLLASGVYASGAFFMEQKRRADELIGKTSVRIIVGGLLLLIITGVVVVFTTKDYKVSNSSSSTFSQAASGLRNDTQETFLDLTEGKGQYETGAHKIKDKDGSPYDVCLLFGEMDDDKLIAEVKPYAMYNCFQLENLMISERCTRYVLGFGVEKLTLYNMRLTEFLFTEIGKMKRLKHLKIAKCGDVPPGLLAHLKNLKTLETIYVETGPAYPNIGKELADTKTLHSIELHQTSLTREDFKPMSEKLRMAMFKLQHGKLTPDALDDLSKWKICRILHFTEIPMNMKHLQNISSVPHLYELNLHKTEVDDEMLPGLYNAKELQALDLTRTFVTTSGLRALRKALPGLRDVRSGVVEHPDEF